MKLIQSRIVWFLMPALALLTVFGILSATRVQGSSSQSFTLAEAASITDENGDKTKWQYTARASNAVGPIDHWRNSPWHWKHSKDPTCDDDTILYPANPESPDTAISADGQEVTVNVYQKEDSVWVCFQLECDNGSNIHAQMRNLQTEATITSDSCSTGNSPPPNNDEGNDDPVVTSPPNNDEGNDDPVVTSPPNNDEGNDDPVVTSPPNNDEGNDPMPDEIENNPLIQPEINPPVNNDNGDGDNGDNNQDDSDSQEPDNTPEDEDVTPKYQAPVPPPTTKLTSSQQDGDSSNSNSDQQKKTPYDGPWK